MGQVAARLPRDQRDRREQAAPEFTQPTVLWYGVHLPYLGLEIFERRYPSRPDERGRPTVLMDGKGVSLMNVPARDAGIALGSTLATARSITADLRHFNRDTDEEQRCLRLLAEAAYQYSPRVAMPAEDCLVLDAGASLKLFGGAEALAASLLALLQRLGHAARIAAARTPAASMVLARAGIPSIAAADRSFDALRAAPLECAGAEIEARDIERLANMGIFQFGQLLDLPRDELGARFGVALPDYLARLAGDVPDPVRPIVPREKFSSSLHLIESVSDKEALLFPMRRLVSELATWLSAKQLGVRSLTWRFEPLGGRNDGRDGCELTAKFADPRLDAKGILAVSKLELEGAEVPDEVMSIHLAVAAAEPMRPEQIGPADLFGAKQASEGLPMELVDLISARLGRDALQGLALSDDHRPEFAWTPRSPNAKRGTPPEGSFHPRPLWLFEPPRPIDIEHFRCLSGPERIESGWWGETVARDYFIAVHGSGAQCWIYANRRSGAERRSEDRQNARGAWFLHGYFA
ncbi:MAG: DNA polymerase Y family protein [bacterium]|nr:DNA polymerase Y family protein [bacterium]